MCGDAHGDEHDEEVDPYGGVGQPSKFLQRAHLPDDEPDERPDKTADGVAEFKLGDFGQGFAAGDDDEADGADELDGLEHVEQIPGPLTVDAEGQVAIVLHGELV